jgi:hypothetical protein
MGTADRQAPLEFIGVAGQDDRQVGSLSMGVDVGDEVSTPSRTCMTPFP